MRLSKVQVVAVVVSSLFVSTSLIFSCYRLYRHLVTFSATRSDYYLDTIIQTGPERGGVPTLYLAELLGLSVDKPTHYYFFDEKMAEKRLLESPVIKEAHIEKVAPRSIYIDYSISTPYFLLADLEGRALDEEGKIIPMRPFFSPKKLPQVYLGMKKEDRAVDRKKFLLASFIYHFFEENKEGTSLEWIDVSLVDHPSYGKREIVLRAKWGAYPYYLRLSADRYKEGLIQFFSVKETLHLEQSSDTIRVIDLRIDDLAYVEDYASK